MQNANSSKHIKWLSQKNEQFKKIVKGLEAKKLEYDEEVKNHSITIEKLEKELQLGNNAVKTLEELDEKSFKTLKQLEDEMELICKKLGESGISISNEDIHDRRSFKRHRQSYQNACNAIQSKIKCLNSLQETFGILINRAQKGAQINSTEFMKSVEKIETLLTTSAEYEKDMEAFAKKREIVSGENYALEVAEIDGKKNVLKTANDTTIADMNKEYIKIADIAAQQLKNMRQKTKETDNKINFNINDLQYKLKITDKNVCRYANDMHSKKEEIVKLSKTKDYLFNCNEKNNEESSDKKITRKQQFPAPPQ
jgi:hypothetical protein